MFVYLSFILPVVLFNRSICSLIVVAFLGFVGEGPPFYTQRRLANPTKWFSFQFYEDTHWGNLCFFLSIHLFHCTFFSKYVSLLCLSIFRFFCCLSWYLPPIYLQSTYLYVYLRTFSSCKPSVLSIVSFNMSNIDIFVCSLFCLCLPKLFFFTMFLWVYWSVFLSIICLLYVTIWFLYYWFIDISVYLVICLSFSFILSVSPSSTHSSQSLYLSIFLSTCRYVSCWCSGYPSSYLWFFSYVHSLHDSFFT